MTGPPTGPPTGPLIGRGRAADVYDVGDGRVLRRYRTPRSCEHEFAVMTRLHACGYPVPEVFSVDRSDLVMERLEGRTMLASLASAPWRAGRYGRLLADLHRRLGDVEVPAGLELPVRFTACRDGERDECVVTHLDLHPDNVMLTAAGPVVFDWSNACLAPPGTDVAMTWLLIDTSEVVAPRWQRPIAGVVRRRLLAAFLRAAGGLPGSPLVRAVVAHRLADPNVRPTERERLADLADRVDRCRPVSTDRLRRRSRRAPGASRAARRPTGCPPWSPRSSCS